MIETVYSENSYETEKDLQRIKKGENKHLSNMPTNVLYNSRAHNLSDDMKLERDCMYDFLLHVSERYPHYIFLTEGRTDLSYDNILHAREIAVFSGEEPLGRIKNLYTREFVFRNNRVQREVKRGRGKKTTKLSVAKSMFAKYFYGITTNERMQVVASEVTHKLNHTLYTLRAEQRGAEQGVKDFVISQLDNQFLTGALKTMGGADLVQKHQEAAHALELVNTIDNVRHKDRGYYVLLEGEQYLHGEMV